MATANCLYPSLLQNSIFCVQQKKEMHTGLEQIENYPFKKDSHTARIMFFCSQKCVLCYLLILLADDSI